ncbi:MAG: ketol-acid reductoisomerase [Deltaproteobacteria bacterium]|nr:ketol-acid reductoisomerase [Deltaproteobacteria bacterium]
MAKIYYDQDANLDLIRAKKVAVIGYGSQGHAHALNLKESGVAVKVGLHEGSKSRKKATDAGLEVGSVAEVSKWADVVMILAPDTSQAAIYNDHIKANLEPGNWLLFGHGFNIHFGTITPPSDVEVGLVAPKGPGHRVRETYQSGQGTPALIAVLKEGTPLDLPLAYAKGIGATRAGALVTTFGEETETDLFGEQVVLCGGVSELVKGAFDTLVGAGYQPEVAYFECLHELKLIVDLMYRGGLNYMRYSVSDTAEHGDYVTGRRIINDQTRGEMKKVLTDIQDGTFAKRWIEENETGRKSFEKRRAEEREHLIESVGAKIRKLIPFIDDVTIKPGD